MHIVHLLVSFGIGHQNDARTLVIHADNPKMARYMRDGPSIYPT